MVEIWGSNLSEQNSWLYRHTLRVITAQDTKVSSGASSYFYATNGESEAF